jgi:hypothetical protein
MAHHLFDVPEIMAIIARMCDRRDDVRCLRVNRAFHDAFVGRVWRVVHIDAFRMSRGPTVEAFERHKHWIQKLELLGSSNWTGSFGGHRLLNHAEVAALQNHAEVVARQAMEASILNLLASADCKLHSLEISSDRLSRAWLNALLQCEGIQELNLEGRLVMVIEQGDVGPFLEICSRIKTLSLSNILFREWSAVHPNELTSVQHLSVGELQFLSEQPTPGTPDISLENAIIRQCPNVRSVEYIYFHPGEDEYEEHFKLLVPHFEKFEHLHSLDISAINLEDMDTCLGSILEI